MTHIILILIFGAGLIANLAWTFYLFRRNKWFRPGPAQDLAGFESRMERLMTEVHRVTSANVELLESRIDALREVGGLADERLKRIRGSLTDLEILLNRIHRVKQSLGKPSGTDEADGEIAPPPPPEPVRSSRGDAVCGLYRQGLTERQIAQKTGLGIAEIRFLLKLSNVEVRAAAPAP